MLIVRRPEGAWLSITHTSGDVARVLIRSVRTEPDRRPSVELMVDDAPRNFEIGTRPVPRVPAATPQDPD